MPTPPANPTNFASAADTRAKGRIAESAAVRWLEREGYEILDTNFAIRAGEIDVIAIEPNTDGDTLCFIEIKARRVAHFGPAIGAVTPHKQRRIARVAGAYLGRSKWTGPCRFDVLGMDRGEDGWRFTLLRDAFGAG
ncbi:MAG: YraN family protein [bacterium]|nr:YraN family protein [bacterium]